VSAPRRFASKKNCRSVEYKQSGWKLSADGMSITFTDGNQAGTFALYCSGEARKLILSSKINRVRVNTTPSAALTLSAGKRASTPAT